MNKIIKNYDVVVIGGGMSGVCAALASSRKGCRTALIQDRPVLGGMAGSEIRMHICGADHHMQRPNARETGILEEILLTNKDRNPEMNYPIFDSVIWGIVHEQEGLDLYLNTYVNEVEKEDNIIISVSGIQTTSEKCFRFCAKYFVDDTGDGSIGYKAGAVYRIGRESQKEFNESLAELIPDGCTMGNSLLFQARDTGHSVKYKKPKWAYTYDEEQLKNREHEDISSGYWWIELGGGKYDTIHDAELIRDELLKTIYGMWDHIKNGGDHHAENYDLEWVGFLPGKRESRRLIGDYILNQHDIDNSVVFDDAAAYGGWPMDIHTVEGFLSGQTAPTVWNKVNDVYTIPYRCMYSVNIDNLFLAGRAISCSHVAFSSTRVMGTCAVVGQAVGTAASIANKYSCTPREVLGHIEELQQTLLRDDAYIPGIAEKDDLDIARKAAVYSRDSIGLGTGSSGPETTGYEAANVINGFSRTVGESSNCWKEKMDPKDPPFIGLKFDGQKSIKEIRLYLDSNLSREITPSINKAVLGRQENHAPSELVKDFLVEFKIMGQTIAAQEYNSSGQRLQILKNEEPVLCDEITITVKSTYGSEYAAIFEIRCYERFI